MAVPVEVMPMMDGTRRVEFDDVEVINAGLVLWCRVNGAIVAIPPLRLLPGTEIRMTGDRGRLVLPEDVAADLGLLEAF